MSERPQKVAFTLSLLMLCGCAWALWLASRHIGDGGGAGFGLMAFVFFCGAVGFGYAAMTP